MACERYEKNLDAFAIGSLEPEHAAQLQAHLRACPKCQSALEAKKRVYQTIDEGLHLLVNEELPAGFAAGIHARVNAINEVRSSHALLVWAAAAAVASVVLALTLTHDWKGNRTKFTAREPVTQPTVEQLDIPDNLRAPSEQPARPSHQSAPPAVVPHVQSRRQNSDAQLRSTAMPEVLVPAERQRAMAQLLDGLRKGELEGDLLVADTKGPTTQQIEIDPVVIEPIRVEPLKQVEQDTNRSEK